MKSESKNASERPATGGGQQVIKGSGGGADVEDMVERQKRLNEEGASEIESRMAKEPPPSSESSSAESQSSESAPAAKSTSSAKKGSGKAIKVHSK